LRIDAAKWNEGFSRSLTVKGGDQQSNGAKKMTKVFTIAILSIRSIQMSHLRKLLPNNLDVILTRLLRSRRAASERSHYSAAALRYTFPSRLEARVNNRAEWLAFTDVFVGKIYDEAIAAALATANLSRTFHVLDLGANVGYFALRFLDLAIERFGRDLLIHIVLAEPTKSLCAELETRLIRQIPPNVSVKLVNGLAGAKSGSAELYESDFHISNSLTPDRYAEKSIVPYVDLDQITESMDRIHLLKCDIEGSEQAFLENYPQLLERIEVGTMELHHSLNDSRRCLDLLQEYGFQVHTTRATDWFDEIWFSRA
jgi:FkbM family methyltransferase